MVHSKKLTIESENITYEKNNAGTILHFIENKKLFLVLPYDGKQILKVPKQIIK